MDEEEYIKHFKAIDFKLKMDYQNMYVSVKNALVEVANDLFRTNEEAS